MIVVTGGFGFIGSSVIKSLNSVGYKDILVVDDLEKGEKFENLVDADFCDFMHFSNKKEIINSFQNNKIDAVIHMGACSDTQEWNGNYMMFMNHEFTKFIFDICAKNNIKFIYASSAATYGLGELGYSESSENLKLLNVYGLSKLISDRYIFNKNLACLPTTCVGIRFFNVFGPNENHKGAMASVISHWYKQADSNSTISIFGEYGGIEAGAHKRDFIYVKDCARLIVEILETDGMQGIYNMGSGEAHSFNTLANIMKKWFEHRRATKIDIKYIDFPEKLRNRYQVYTCSDNSKLKYALGDLCLTSLSDAVFDYLDYLDKQ